MDETEFYRDYVLTAITEDMPAGFWTDVLDGTKHVYGESFAAVSADTALVPDQRPQKLLQERYFKMEHMICAVSSGNGVPASAKLIGENSCYYAYAGRGRIGLTQSYTPVSGEMPTPAAFRKQLAKTSDFKRTSRLNLGDEPSELILPKQIIGILVHSPAGKKFSASEMQLGAVGFYVAYEDYSAWAAQLPLVEIIASYKPTEEREDRVRPVRRTAANTGTDE